jgi:hypothetical protein
LKILVTVFVIIVLMPICFGFKSQQQNSPYPPEKFSVIKAKRADGKPVVGSIDLAYSDYADKARYPWCLTINIALDLKKVSKDGLPIWSESQIADKLEDELIRSLRKIETAHYVGHLFNDTFLDIYIYLDNPEKANNYLKKQVNKEGLVRGFAYEIKKDPDWTTVKGFFK